MTENNQSNPPEKSENSENLVEFIDTEVKNTEVDENMHLFIFGNIKIRDVNTGEILVNQRF